MVSGAALRIQTMWDSASVTVQPGLLMTLLILAVVALQIGNIQTIASALERTWMTLTTLVTAASKTQSTQGNASAMQQIIIRMTLTKVRLTGMYRY